ncbi:hypothetical protein RND61_10345 [Streptomyces sp. TRM76323]|uniref:Uncharacterized protein n=1 Tax=Streptomyces tamarix TaxID=3078565 RepID=A0ABU3QI87_9ACTN|nr:hypothetical protein [Streptomyces tamarix]MDT9682465.1 hypothetical protein [Streptomyces tamarix]
MISRWESEQSGESTVVPSTTPDITTTVCGACGSQVSGLNGRYACGVCGWVNNWAEGHSRLPSAEEDPDAPKS